MKKFLLKPINDVIEKRKENIEAKLEAAGQTTTEANNLKAEYENSLMKVKEEAEKLLDGSSKKAQAEYEHVIEQANIKAEQIIREADKKSEEERKRMLHEINTQITDLAMDVAEKIVGEKCDDSLNHSLYDEFLKEAGDQDDTKN